MQNTSRTHRAEKKALISVMLVWFYRPRQKALISVMFVGFTDPDNIVEFAGEASPYHTTSSIYWHAAAPVCAPFVFHGTIMSIYRQKSSASVVTSLPHWRQGAPELNMLPHWRQGAPELNMGPIDVYRPRRRSACAGSTTHVKQVTAPLSNHAPWLPSPVKQEPCKENTAY